MKLHQSAQKTDQKSCDIHAIYIMIYKRGETGFPSFIPKLTFW